MTAPVPGRLDALRHQAVIDAGNLAIAYAIDSRRCLFCKPRGRDGLQISLHDATCPLRSYFQLLDEMRRGTSP